MSCFKSAGMIAALLVASLLALPATSFALPKKGQPAPPFQVVSTSGQRISLANYRGSVLVVEFFATWCGGCNDAVPHLINLQKQYGKQGLQILGLNVGQGDNLELLKDFAATRRLNYPVAIADEETVYDNYAILRIPVMFIINKKGVLVEKLDGFNSYTKMALENTVRKLLAE